MKVSRLAADGSGGVGLRSRRQLLAGLAAVGASTILPGGKLPGQAPAANARRFDFHHHFASPRFLALIGSLKESGYQTWEKNYSVSKDLELMDRAEVATSFLSLTTPGISQGNDEQTRALARDLNEFG